MNEYVIETRKVTKKYGSFTALDHVDLHVGKGSVYGLIGDNGAGKSTLLKILAGLSYAAEGEVVILGRNKERDLESVRRNIGCMIEQPGLFPDMTVEQTLKYYCIQKGVPDERRVEEMLSLVSLEQKRKSKCASLSLGQKQRLGLAIAMTGSPQILMLDEPINGLDPSGIVEFRSLLHRLSEDQNITILLSSHILSELEQIATEYGFLSRGRLLEEISAEELREKCADCIEMTVSDAELYAAALTRELPREQYKVFPGSLIRIYRPQAEAERFGRLASENGVYITEMQTLRTSLENYYMELKESCYS